MAQGLVSRAEPPRIRLCWVPPSPGEKSRCGWVLIIWQTLEETSLNQKTKYQNQLRAIAGAHGYSDPFNCTEGVEIECCLQWHSVTGFIFVSYAGGPFKLRLASILHGQLPYYIRVFWKEYLSDSNIVATLLCRVILTFAYFSRPV